MADVKTADTPSKALPQPTGFFGKFLVLKGAVRELWIVFGVKLVAILAYAVMNSTLVLWLSSDLGYNDKNAGFLVLCWSALMTLFTLFVGSLTDAIGLRRAFLMGAGICILCRTVMTFSTTAGLALGCGLLPLALGEAMLSPVMTAAIQRYTNTAQRSISFSIFYAMMNVGFLFSSYIFDYVRKGLGEYGQFTVPLIGVHLSTYRTLFLCSLLLSVPTLLLIYFWLRNGVEVTDHGVIIKAEKERAHSGNMVRDLAVMVRDAAKDTGRIFAGLWNQPGFYKFLAFLTLASFMRLIFVHMYYTYPKFGIRELGEGAPIGRLWAINSMLIIILVPVVGALTQRISAYRMVTIGSFIAASSVFLLAMPPSWVQPLADGRLGHGIANVWFGGYSRFSGDDFRDTQALAKTLQDGSNPASKPVYDSLSAKTKGLLARESAEGYRNPNSRPYPSSAFISAAQIKDIPAFAARLQNDPQPGSRALSQWLWTNSFSASAKEILLNTSADDKSRNQAFVDELNRVLQNVSLFGQPCLAGFKLSEETVASVEYEKDPTQAGKLRPKQSIVLNRLILEDVYRDDIARSEHPLRVALADDLNKLINSGNLTEKAGFSSVALSKETQELLAGKPEGDKLARANRQVVEDAFPQQIAKNRLHVAGSVNPYYVMIFLYVVLLSVGESIYSPRLYEYSAAIAPKGQEASYLAMAFLPFFFAKLAVAAFSGVLLAAFCPLTGPRNSDTLWLVIALTTMIAPIGLVVCKRFIRVREAGRDD